MAASWPLAPIDRGPTTDMPFGPDLRMMRPSSAMCSTVADAPLGQGERRPLQRGADGRRVLVAEVASLGDLAEHLLEVVEGRQVRGVEAELEQVGPDGVVLARIGRGTHVELDALAPVGT